MHLPLRPLRSLPDRHAVALIATVNTVVLSAAAVGQWLFWTDGEGRAAHPYLGSGRLLAVVFLGTSVPGLAAVASVVLLGVVERRPLGRLLVGAPVVAVFALASSDLMCTLRPEPTNGWDLLIGFLSAAVSSGLGIVIGLVYIDNRARIDAAARAAEHAIAAVERDELDARRAVSRQLHGPVQHRLVMIAADLEALTLQVDGASRDQVVAQLTEVIARIDELREREVRELSHVVFPSGTDIHLHPAVVLVMSRLPRSVRPTLTLTPRARAVDDVTRPHLAVEQRLLLLQTVEEAFTNAVKHGRATAIDILCDVETDPEPDAATGRRRATVHLVVADNGTGICTDVDTVLHGLADLRVRLRRYGGDLSLTNGERTGCVLRVSLPFLLREY
ncbi:sensor histidine kinase [Cellulomonas hominis]